MDVKDSEKQSSAVKVEAKCDPSLKDDFAANDTKDSDDVNTTCKMEEDEDRDFLQEGFFDNLAVVDSCYSDEENEEGSPKLDSSQIADNVEQDVPVEEKVIETLKKAKSPSTAEGKVRKKEDVRSRSLKGKGSDHVYEKNENVHTRVKVAERDTHKGTRSKDQSSEYRRSKEKESTTRKSSEVQARRRSSRDRDGSARTYNSSRTRSSIDEKKRHSSRDHEATEPDRTRSRYPYDHSSDKRYDSIRPRKAVGARDKPETSTTSKTTTKPPNEAPVVKIPADDLVPPGTEDVKLPKPVTDEQSIVEKDQKAEKRKRMSQESNECRKKKRLSPEVMTRDRVVEDQNRMSRELSMERLLSTTQARSREKSHERREAVRRSNRLRLDLEDVRRKNQEINDELQRRRDMLREAEYIKRRSSSSKRRRSISSERFTSRSGQRYSRSNEHGSRHVELSPISGGRMSRHSDEFSLVLSPEQYEYMRVEHRDRRRSFSPISSASSMISLSSEEGRGGGRRKRKRSPFWKEMERKLGIKMMSGRMPDTPPLQAQYPLMQVDVSAPPPGVYPVAYPMPGPGVEQFPPPMFYDAGPPYFPLEEQRPEPIPKPAPAPRPNLRFIAEKRVVNFLFKVVPSKKQTISTEPPEAPPPPQISAPLSDSASKMSLSSLLEASLKGTVATKSNAESGANLSQLIGEDRSAGTSGDGRVAATVARCDAAIAALRVDNVLNVITSGRFSVRPNVVPPGALYSAIKRFDHPAQESMIKLKSPLLRSSIVKLAYTTPPLKPVVQKLVVQKPVIQKPKETPTVQPTPVPKPASIVAPTNAREPAVPVVNETVVVTPLPSTINKEPAATGKAPPLANEPASLADDISDSEIEFLAEVPKTVNVIATLDLDPVEEEVKLPIDTWSANAAVDETSDISEAELMSDISLSEGDMHCAKCQQRSKIKMVNASTQYMKRSRTVETQVDFAGGVLQGSARVYNRRTRKRNLVREALDSIDDSLSPQPEVPPTTNQSSQFSSNQSGFSKSVPNPIQFQKESENPNASKTSFKSFSFAKDGSSLTPNTPSVNPLPLSSAGLSLKSATVSNPSSVIGGDNVSKPAVGGAFFKQSFQSVAAVRQPSIFGGSKTPAPSTSVRPPAAGVRPTNPAAKPKPPQKSILKPKAPLQSASSMPLFGGTLLQPSVPPPVQPPLSTPQTSFSNAQQFQKQQQPFQNVQPTYPNTQPSFQTSSFPYSNQQQQCPPPNTRQPFQNPQESFPNFQQFPNNGPSYNGNQTFNPGFQQMYPNDGNFSVPGNNFNQGPQMMPNPMQNNFVQQQQQNNNNQGQGQPFFNPLPQSNVNQNYFQNNF